jgi:hypothetical protein
MSRVKPTPEVIAGIVARIPEGYISRSRLSAHFRLTKNNAKKIDFNAVPGQLGRVGDFFFDPVRVKPEQVRALSRWTTPEFPEMRDDQTFVDTPVSGRMVMRNMRLTAEERALIDRIADPGYAERAAFMENEADTKLLETMLARNLLAEAGDLIYDPLLLGEATMRRVLRQRELAPTLENIVASLKTQKGETNFRHVLDEQFGAALISELVKDNRLIQFQVTWKHEPNTIAWITHPGADIEKARRVADAACRIQDSDWEPLLELAGNRVRPDAKDARTFRGQVMARSYALANAARRLGAKPETLERALRGKHITAFEDPNGHIRVPAAEVEKALEDPEYALHFTGSEIINVREIALVTGLSYSGARYRLGKEGVNRGMPRWSQIHGKWGLPEHLHEFRELVRVKKAEWREKREAARLEEEHRLEEERRRQIEEERRQREELRTMLLPIFPTWRHEGDYQQVILRLGPPNSGKTHQALQALAQAGSGWYLAPLRLLAFEIFDRLNAQGVPCNLLTGEEYIPVEGALITSATVEMFNPENSGACVIIDEAHMLADPDRGWAWTRALMEAQSPDIHVIAPATVEKLVESLGKAVSLPVKVVEHERLAPIKVADKPFNMKQLPPRTILVAFSRFMVLELKTLLEAQGRSVSVVYGNLPPEVRRRQADRFANGETEICIATDAVGMGLNLPADFVCFYEVEKFDGTERRPLKPSEVQQIGGRAGRFGLSQAGEVGAIERHDHELLRKLMETTPPPLTHARVAPSVEALELLPGTLAQKLDQWSRLQSIPDHLRNLLKTGDMAERVALASMLRPQEVEALGLARAVKLVNAPTREKNRAYWRRCVSAILAEADMPLPAGAPAEIRDQIHLEQTEDAIGCADIYLWLGRRSEFTAFASDEDEVRRARSQWALNVDAALLKKVESARKCSRCGRRLPKGHAYNICDHCYFGSFRSRYENDDDSVPRRRRR